MAKRIKPAKKRKAGQRQMLRTGFLTKLAILALLAAVGWQLLTLQDQVRAAEAERDRVAVAVESQKQENDALAADIAEGPTPEKMQEIARRELGWVLPGEYLFGTGS